VLALLAPIGAGAGYAEHEEITPARLSYLEGDAAFRRSADPWTRALLNTPLAVGDTLQTGADGRIELQLAPAAFVRTAGHSVVVITEQTENNFGIDVASGTVAVDWRAQGGSEPMSLLLETRHGQIGIDQPGYYRIEVTPTDTRLAVRNGGLATVTPRTADPFDVPSEHGAGLAGQPGAWTLASGLGTDQWDEWNRMRTDQVLSASSRQYLAEDVYGAEALDQHGTWRQHQQYGPIWYPNSVGRTWAPFSTGTWLRDPRFGWSWVDRAAWGWAPFHYGRWVNLGGRWGWAPRGRYDQVSYVPATVRFLDGPYAGTSVIRWVPLGWDDPFDPYWDPAWTTRSHTRHRIGERPRSATAATRPAATPSQTKAPAVISMPASSFGVLPALPVPNPVAQRPSPSAVAPASGGAAAIRQWTAPAQNPGVAPPHPMNEAIQRGQARQGLGAHPPAVVRSPTVTQSTPAAVIAPTVTTPPGAYQGWKPGQWGGALPQSSSAARTLPSAPPAAVSPRSGAGAVGANAPAITFPRQSLGSSSGEAPTERRAVSSPRSSGTAAGGSGSAGNSISGGALTPRPSAQGLGTFLGKPGCTSPGCAGR
jgi:hypothetical protein